MTKRIFWSISAVAMTVLLACLVLFMGVLYSYFTEIQMNQLRTETLLAAEAVTFAHEDYFKNLQVEDCRITWIDADGTVLYDNQAGYQEMENHLEREEIVEAMESGWGESSRYSNTKTHRYLYCARRLSDGSVMRLSAEHPTVINLVLEMSRLIVLVIAVALGLSVFLAYRVSKLVVRPLNELNLDMPLENVGYPEISPLLHRLNAQQQHLRQQSAKLRRKQDEFDAVVCSMGEGLILLNNQAKILTMNHAAASLLDARWYCKGEDFMSLEQGKRIQDVVRSALDGTGAEKIVMFREEAYQVDATPVTSGGMVSGAVILIFDVTEKQKAENMRREFTANVSHELKTPLQSISGYAELLSCGMVKPEDVGNFSGQIYRESQRMIRLVEDIMRLSRLDETTGEVVWEKVDLYKVAEEAVSIAAGMKNPNGVSVSLHGSSVEMDGIHQQVLAIAVNLVSNAVKYNRPEGIVEITAAEDGPYAVLTVRDTGIGIPQEHQERIFERFYRVDKSHSKEVGGTGLGLSIVKHAAHIHKARITLESAAGTGSVFTVRFPRRQDA